MKKMIVAVVFIIMIRVLYAQSSSLPAVLKNVTHDYSNTKVVSTTASLELTSVKLIADEIAFVPETKTLNVKACKSIKGRRIVFASKEILIDNSIIEADEIFFSKEVTDITINGSVRFICNKIDFDTSGSINVNKGTSTGNLFVDYKVVFNGGVLKINDGVNVAFIKK